MNFIFIIFILILYISVIISIGNTKSYKSKSNIDPKQKIPKLIELNDNINIDIITNENAEYVYYKSLYRPKNCKKHSKNGDKIQIHYESKIYNTDGQAFYSSRNENKPLKFKLGAQILPIGMEVGMMSMCEDEKRSVIIPSKYAYGAQSQGSIPAHSTLLMEITLLSISNEDDAEL